MRVRLLGVTDEAEHDRLDAQPVEADQWRCLRCDSTFAPHPCPECGSYKIEGANGVSGQPFEQSKLAVTCWDCRAEFPAHSTVVAKGYGG
ncbi:hypothetical protein [Nonomuraea sp. NPDC023979]|uniref:hypothetical protein n=1 Tax=Nonomuraea sp. NPDC023979 TaxID=3154796 RepID=UPI0033E9064F